MNNLSDRPRIQIKFGHSIILDADTWKVIRVIHFHPISEMSTKKMEELNFVIKNIYVHTLARSEVLVCGSVKGIEHWGVTAFSAKTGRKEELICEDESRMLAMAAINKILAEMMASLCLHVYLSNRALAIHHPSFADLTWSKSPNANVVGSSIVCTRNGFNNNPHTDGDDSPYAHRLFARVNRTTGELHWVLKSDYLGDIVGCRFILDQYHVEILLDSCDGVVETIWAPNEKHHTSASTTYDEGWAPIWPAESPITRFGCSLQINKALVQRIDAVVKLKEGKTNAEWEAFKHDLVKCYKQEVEIKVDKIHNPTHTYNMKKSRR
ncbi:hypothetical protein DFH28DRAFT_1200901 [Melampsora americana]|nr:hypothetical protein DFH28DRAFT_1200901 [Melampsora americana]